nr:putative sulfate exporter family transporter [uncultured Holophaga sp.]
MDTRNRLSRILLPLGALAAISPWLGPASGLLLGIAVGLFLGNPWPAPVSHWTKKCLSWSIIALGAGMNLGTVLKVGSHGILITFFSITLTMTVGYLLARFLRIRAKAGTLVAAGTAICGGSAIAALAPAIGAPEEDTGVALVTVFLLNAVALVLFPFIGHTLGMSQHAFGLWSALAIHDTSSVVGAGLAYGQEALAVGTTVKLARALWIVPLTLAAATLFRTQQGKRRHPWFILGFILSAAACTWIPALHPLGAHIAWLGRKGMGLALFGIGCGISLGGLKRTGPRPLAMGLILWAVVASASLVLIRFGWVS